MNNSLRIVFAGSPEFSVPTLDALMQSAHRVVAVYTQPDRPAGRGRKIQTSAVKQAAIRHDLPVLQPVRLSGTEELATLEQINADLMVVVAYGLILPQAILETPAHGCWNIHASLLPRWRGAAPIQRAIIAGDELTGVSIMQMDAGLDTGAVLASKEIAIHGDETGGSLHDRLAALGANALLPCIDRLAAGEPIEPREQESSGACYAEKLSKQEAEINWHEPAEFIARKIRAFNPWPVAWTRLDDERLRIWSAMAMQCSAERPGEIIARTPEGIDVSCGEGCLRITEMQKAGGKRISAADYLNARK
jgi:methionyl-tRNA formyltransferase